MKTLLFVNACIRENSRTEALARRYLEKAGAGYQIEEVKVSELGLCPLDAAALRQRDADTAEGKLGTERYRLAQQFAAADRIVMAAPYWDCLFPAAWKVYLEHICVAGITFAYGADGSLVKTCRADRLVCLTTCGGFLPEHSAAESLLHELGRLFSVEEVRFYAAEGLDAFPDRVEETLQKTLERMQN